jgi:hypothetical protein
MLPDETVRRFSGHPWVYEFLYHYALDEFREQIRPVAWYATKHGTSRQTIRNVIEHREKQRATGVPVTFQSRASKAPAVAQVLPHDVPLPFHSRASDVPRDRETETETETKPKRKSAIPPGWPTEVERARLRRLNANSTNPVENIDGWVDGYAMHAGAKGTLMADHVLGCWNWTCRRYDTIRPPEATGPGGQKLSNAEAKSLRIKETTRRALEKALLPSVPPGPALPEKSAAAIVAGTIDNFEEIE